MIPAPRSAPSLAAFAGVLLMASTLNAEATVASHRVPACSCDDLAACTAVQGIPILFAQRDAVRSTLKERGLRALSEDDSRMVDVYEARDAEYTTVRAFFDEDRQLAELNFEYPATRLERLLADGPPLLGAQPGRAHGSFGRDEDSSRQWVTRDGVAVWLSRKRGEDFVVMSFEATDARARLDASRRDSRHRQIEWDEFLKADGLAADASDASAPQGLSTNALQGHLSFRAETPLLIGKTELATDFCGSATDLDTGESPPSGLSERFDISGYRKPVNRVEVEKRADGSLHVVLRVRDGGGSRFDFGRVVAGKPARGEVRGDCRARSITVTYESTALPTCVNANLDDWPVSRIVGDLAQERGLEFDHLDLLRDTQNVSLHGAMNTDVLMTLLADISNLYFDRVAPNRFSLREPGHGSASLTTEADKKP